MQKLDHAKNALKYSNTYAINDKIKLITKEGFINRETIWILNKKLENKFAHAQSMKHVGTLKMRLFYIFHSQTNYQCQGHMYL